MDMDESLVVENYYASFQQMHWRTELNNMMMRRRMDLRYEFKVEGAPHQAQWTAVAYVNGRTYGAGLGKTKGEAKENASKVALFALKDQGEEKADRKTKRGAAERQTAVEDAILKKKATDAQGGGDAQR
ncbi:hypothetical protein LshimejAT787_1303380 [Lyophyllum shimeji]|uniref:DRBM domain-containing protein n=1 Tax=Lyophyllum shimeji TaxID=47721 RepID=A0A9P3USQ3_LYOSH|nr:hypothetical protein LshimejAT787_1303380 [Lyophyllum shimeji]